MTGGGQRYQKKGRDIFASLIIKSTFLLKLGIYSCVCGPVSFQVSREIVSVVIHFHTDGAACFNMM